MDSFEAIAGPIGLILSLVFAVSLAAKLADVRAFLQTVRNYRIVTSRLTLPVAWLILLGEFLVVASLIGGYFPRLGALIGLALLGSFALAAVIAMRRGQNLNCGCFGLLYRERVGPSTLARDGALALLFAMVALAPGGVFTVKGTFLSDRVTPSGVVHAGWILLDAAVVSLPALPFALRIASHRQSSRVYAQAADTDLVGE